MSSEPPKQPKPEGKSEAPKEAPPAVPPTDQPQPEPSFTRPCVSLSVHLTKLYKAINHRRVREQRMHGGGPKYNDGYDDSQGHYIVIPGEQILDRFVVHEVLGKGSFGTVLRCSDEKYNEEVAVKITRGGNYFYNQAKLEVDILLKLNGNAILENLVVKLRKVFMWRGHLVLVFELLSYNLYQLIKCTKHNGVSLDLTRKFAYQLLQVLKQLECYKPPIVHCDLKPENVLLRDQYRSGIRLIDFGSACYYSPTPRHKYIQSRFYRSPEVILELPYTTAIDRWSLGVMLVEMHTGVPVFSGKTEMEQLARFQGVLGPIPEDMIKASPKRDKFYTFSPSQPPTLKTQPEPHNIKTLEEIIGVYTGGPRGCRRGTTGHDEESYRVFHDFTQKLLQYDPNKRMSCTEALAHPFLAPLLQMELQVAEQAKLQGGTAAPAATGPSQPTPQPVAPQPVTK